MKKILIACIASLFSSCFGEQPVKDKYPNIQEFSKITTSEYKIIKTNYEGFRATKNFYFTMEQVKDSRGENLVILNKKFEVLKKIQLKSEDSRFAVFDNFIFIIEDSDSSNSVIKMNFPAFKMESIEFMPEPQVILDSIRNSLPDSLLKSLSMRKNPANQHFGSLYCNAMVNQLSENLNEVYEINFPSHGRYFMLDYEDKMLYYKDNRRFYPKTCWSDLQKKKVRFGGMIDYAQDNRILPFDKAFTKWIKNRAIGGKQKSGYQYFKIKTKNRELKFKKFLGQYFNPRPQFSQVYTNVNKDTLLLQEHSNGGTMNTLYWVIEQTE